MILYVIGIGIACFLVFILLTKRQKSFADKMILAWLSAILIHLILFAIICSGEFINFPYLLGMEIPFPLLHGPFLFLYTKSLIDLNPIKIKSLLHFIPFTLALLSIIPFLWLTRQEKIVIYQSGGQGYQMLKTLILIGIILSGVIYIMLTLNFLVKHISLSSKSNSQSSYLGWIFKLISGLSLIWMVVILADEKYVFYAVVLFVLFIGYYGIKQLGIFTNQPQLVFPIASQTMSYTDSFQVNLIDAKYEKSLLTNVQLESIHHQLQLLMEVNRLFLIPELSLTIVAKNLDIHPNTLSLVINKLEQKNFFDYINTLRVEEFKNRVLLSESHRFTLLSIAYQCGFNSKTSFNRNFKKIIGQSPSEFLKENQIKLK